MEHWEGCNFELDALGALMADVVDKADDLTFYPLAADAPEQKPDGLQTKPSIKARLAAKPVPGDQPIKKTKDLEVR